MKLRLRWSFSSAIASRNHKALEQPPGRQFSLMLSQLTDTPFLEIGFTAGKPKIARKASQLANVQLFGN